VLAVAHFFAFRPNSTMRMLRRSHIAGFRLPIASAGGFESQPLANFDSVRIYSRSLQLIDVQKHIRTAGVVCDKSEASVGVPHFQFAGGHFIFLFQPEFDQAPEGQEAEPPAAGVSRSADQAQVHDAILIRFRCPVDKLCITAA
jgi:hypothetical protein